jgi:hypothetical protein
MIDDWRLEIRDWRLLTTFCFLLIFSHQPNFCNCAGHAKNKPQGRRERKELRNKNFSLRSW